MTKILKKLLLFFSIAAVVMYITSCAKDYYLILPPPIPDRPICYYGEVQPIWDAKCVSCHRGATPPDLREANSFNALLNGGHLTPLNEESSLYIELTPTPKLRVHLGLTTPEENGIVLGWLLQGANEFIPEED